MAKKLSNRQKVRNFFLWSHRWLGLISGIIVFIVAITGCLYVFEEEGREIFQHKYLYVDAPKQGVRKSIPDLTTTVLQSYPGETITQIRFREKANAAFIFYTKTDKAISINPYTAQVIGYRDMKSDFFNWILDMHRRLKMGKTGNEIIKWNVLIFFIMCVTGLIIWWPKQRRFFKQAATIKFRTKNMKRLNWDLHSVLGFYALAVLFIISLTGIFWMFDWAKDSVRFVTQSKEVKQKKAESDPVEGASFSLASAYETAKQLYPGAEQTFISLDPKDKKAPIRVLFRYPYTLVRKQNTVFFDQYSGKILREDLHDKINGYDKVARANFDLHTGRIRFLGLGSKIIYFLASLFAASLPVTGVIIWLGRKKKATSKAKKIKTLKPALASA